MESIDGVRAELKEIKEIDEERVYRVQNAIYAIGGLDIASEMPPFHSFRRRTLFTSRLTFHTNATGRLDINLSDEGGVISLWATFRGKESPHWVSLEEFEQEIASWIEVRLDSE